MQVFKRAYIDWGAGFIGGRPKGYYVCCQYNIVFDEFVVRFYAGRYLKVVTAAPTPIDHYEYGRESVTCQDKVLNWVDASNARYEESSLRAIAYQFNKLYTLPH